MCLNMKKCFSRIIKTQYKLFVSSGETRLGNGVKGAVHPHLFLWFSVRY